MEKIACRFERTRLCRVHQRDSLSRNPYTTVGALYGQLRGMGQLALGRFIRTLTVCALL